VEVFPKAPFSDAVRLLQNLRKQKETEEQEQQSGFHRIQNVSCDETMIVRPFLPEKDGVMVDVGAHFGSGCLPFLKQGWRVYAFEPDEANRAALIKNAGEAPKLTIESRAASKVTGREYPWYSSTLSSGISGMLPFNTSHKRVGSVTTVTLRDYFIEQGITHVDYLKIDAEGIDIMVLQGFPFESIRPSCIVCEFEDRKTRLFHNGTLADMAALLQAHGYYVCVSEWHPIIRYGITHQWRRFAPWPVETAPMAWGNLVAFAEEPDQQKLRNAVEAASSSAVLRHDAMDNTSITTSTPIHKIRKICILDPGFSKLPGHHHMWNRVLEKTFVEQGYSPYFFCSKRIVPEALSPFGYARAHFVYNFYRRVSENPEPDSIAAFLTHALYMQRDLTSLASFVDSETLVFGHTLDAPSILGIALWHAALPMEQRPPLFLNVQFSFEKPTKWTETSYRLAMENLRGSIVHISGTTDHLAEFLTRVTGQRASVLPMVFDFPQSRKIKACRDIVYGFTGEDRLERNVAVLPDAIEAYIEKGGSGHFLLHLAPADPRTAPYIEALKKLEQRHPEQVTLFLRYISTEEYYGLFDHFTAMLLPFNPDLYHEYRPSQSFQEAVAAGIPCIVCRGGFMGYEADKLQNGSVLMREPTAACLTEALFDFEDSAQQRFNAAAAVGERYRIENSAQCALQHIFREIGGKEEQNT